MYEIVGQILGNARAFLIGGWNQRIINWENNPWAEANF